MKTSVRLAGPLAVAALMTSLAQPARAQVSGTVRVLVRDQQSLALPNASATIKSVTSRWSQASSTNAEGEATFPAVPVGQYVVAAALEGFTTVEKQIAVLSNSVTP